MQENLSIAGQLAPIAGTVFIGRKELSEIGQKELAKELAVVFTKRLHTEMMTCEDVVAGILFENDMDYPVAKALGAHVIAEAPFEKIKEKRIAEAKEWIDRCDSVICCKDKFGEWDKENGFLVEYAKLQGKRVEKPENFFHNRQETERKSVAAEMKKQQKEPVCL